MNRYLFCVTETPPTEEVAVPETEADRREREAARLEVAPAKPGDDPPTYGDEGGGSLYPEGSRGRSPETHRPDLFRRLILQANNLRRRLRGSRVRP